MRTLLIEREAGVGWEAAARLVADGHEVERCRIGDDPLCDGMPGREGCPLDQGAIDVAVAARGRAGGPDTEIEEGVRCAIRRGVPVTVLGSVDGASYRPWVTETSAHTDALGSAVERAARRGWAAVTEPARIAVRHLLGDRATPVTLSIEHVGRRLRATVGVGAPLDERTRQAIAVRVAGLLRPRTKWAQSIDVAVDTFGEAVQFQAARDDRHDAD
jgi:hypothetical protein